MCRRRGMCIKGFGARHVYKDEVSQGHASNVSLAVKTFLCQASLTKYICALFLYDGNLSPVLRQRRPLARKKKKKRENFVL